MRIGTDLDEDSRVGNIGLVADLLHDSMLDRGGLHGCVIGDVVGVEEYVRWLLFC